MEVKQLELSEDLIKKYGIHEVYYTSEKIEINFTNLREEYDTIHLPVLKYAHDTIQQLDSLINGSMSLDAFTHLKYHLTVKLSPIWNEIYSATSGSDSKTEIKGELLNEKVSKQDINFVIETMTKEAKHDNISIKQIFYGMASGLTKIVLHSNVNSKNAGAGKSYLLTLVSDYFPNKHVLPLTGASDKAFQHKEGIMVLEDIDTGELTEVEPIINKLRIEILDFENELETEKLKEAKARDKELVKQLKKQISEKDQEIKSILERQQKLIDLNNTIILLLDTPQDAVTDGLMSLLSNDTTRDQKYLPQFEQMVKTFKFTK